MIKDCKTLCGPACVNYIMNLDRRLETCPDNLFWCCDLATFLSNAGYEVALKCYRSRLYDDYRKNMGHKTLTFEGFISIKNFLSTNNINECDISPEIIKQEIQKYDYCIYNVDSAIFSSRSYSSGHYILIFKEKGRPFLITPLKNKYQKMDLDFSKVYNSTKNFGAWRILISKKI